jgi:6-phosphogluconolactonase (cycloisomerase 2 family)
MRGVLVGIALAALVGAPAANATPFEWIDAHEIVASPDGRNVYAAGGQTLSFRVLESGALDLIGHTEPGASHARIAISPDGRFVYVGRGEPFPSGGIYVLSRDPASGLLTHEQTFGNNAPGAARIGAVADLEMSADGRQLYVAQRNPELVTVFERDTETGDLTQRQALYKGPDLKSAYAMELASSPDGRNVYVAGDSLAILRRDPASGLLTGAGVVRGDATDFNVAVSPDGRRVYGGGSGIDTWKRDAESGALEHLSHADIAGCQCSSFISPAPDGRAVFASAPPDPSVTQAIATDDGLAFGRRYANGENGITGLDYPTAMTWSPDGRFAFVAASSGIRNGSVAAFRRTDDGLAFLGAQGPGFEVPAPFGIFQHPAITIEDGATYTNHPDVRVTVTNPSTYSSLRLSNSDDFAAAPFQRLTASEQTFPWRLATSGPERSVKRVHLRFTPMGRDVIEIFDDIILDERPPEVQTARIAGSHLLVKARDNRSGVKRMQVTASRKKPGKRRAYTRALTVGRSVRTLHVRVFDAAGNISRWQTARRR